MAMPMKSEAREPSANRMITATNRTPVATEFCRSLSICLMTLDLSWVKDTCTAPGQVCFSLSTTYFTPSTVWIRLAPVRLEISIVMAGRPFTRVTVVASLKVGRTCEMSPSVTVAPGEETTGICSTSCGFSISAGTLTAKRPVAPSRAPAATRLLEACATAVS